MKLAMTNWRVFSLYLVFAGLGLLPTIASAQTVAVTWPLTANMGAVSSSNPLVTGLTEVVSGGSGPTVSVFDYWSGQAQRLNAGSAGWIASPPSATRYLQFDASPTAGNQLAVTGVSFQYGGANVNNQIRADVRYSTNNWSSSTVLASAIVYQPNAMTPFTATISIPPIPAGGKFSLRIMPYAIINSTAGAPTFAAHKNVMIKGTSSAISVPQVRLQLTKTTGSTVIPGTYSFHIACTGPGGPYTGPNPVNIPLPGPAVIAQVPQGDTCNVTETPVTGWTAPLFGGSSANIVANGWNAQIGPMNVNTTMTVTNQPPIASTMKFQIQKQFIGAAVPGTYTFHMSCTGAYTGPTTIQLVVPSNPNSATFTIPVGSTCTLTENPVSGLTPPLFGGSGQPINPNQPWGAVIGPIHTNSSMSDRVIVSNRH